MEPKQRLLVGFAGYKYSGKDTAAAGLEGVKLAFGSTLKLMLSQMGLSHAQLHGDQKETPVSWIGLDVTPRRMMETLGTKWGRQMIDEDLWVKVVEKQIWDQRNAPDWVQHCVVVTDVRFEAEADMIRRLGGLVIHIKRGQPEGWWARLKRRFGPASERGIKVHRDDAVVWNNGSIDVLHSAVRKLASQSDQTRRELCRMPLMPQ